MMLLSLREVSSFATSFVGIPSSYSFFVAPIAVGWFTLGTLAFIVAAFICKGKAWAWLFGLVLATDAIVLGGFGLLLGSLAVALPLAAYGLILIFLGLTQVRAYCMPSYIPSPSIFPPFASIRGRGRVNWPAYPPSQFAPVTQAQATWIGVCPSCGASILNQDIFCLRCGIRLR